MIVLPTLILLISKGNIYIKYLTCVLLDEIILRAIAWIRAFVWFSLLILILLALYVFIVIIFIHNK